MNTPLPQPLSYLRPFVRALGKLAAEELNEDLNPAKLEKAIRKRLKGLDEVAAQTQLSKDREILETW